MLLMIVISTKLTVLYHVGSRNSLFYGLLSDNELSRLRKNCENVLTLSHKNLFNPTTLLKIKMNDDDNDDDINIIVLKILTIVTNIRTIWSTSHIYH